MDYSIDDLKDEKRFKLVKVLKYEKIAEFVFENIKKPNIASRLYFIFNLFLLALIFGFTVAGFRNDIFRFGEFIVSFFWGLFAGSIFVIPLHELMHGLAYKIKGAPRIHFGADLRQAIFYVAADKFVVGKNKFLFVALAPFITINSAAVVLLQFASPLQLILILFFLLFHNIMCIGDFAMISFFLDNKGKELYTFDDHHEKTSYLYERIQQGDGNSIITRQ